MNIEILAFTIIPIIAWGLIVHTLLYRDRERVYSAWAKLYSLLEKRLALIQRIIENENNTDEIKVYLSAMDNNIYLPIPKLLENAEFRVRLFLFRARRDDAHGCPL